MDNWTAKDHRIIPELIEFYRNTPVEAILIFKEQISTRYLMGAAARQRLTLREIVSMKRDGGKILGILKR